MRPLACSCAHLYGCTRRDIEFRPLQTHYRTQRDSCVCLPSRFIPLGHSREMPSRCPLLDVHFLLCATSLLPHNTLLIPPNRSLTNTIQDPYDSARRGAPPQCSTLRTTPQADKCAGSSLLCLREREPPVNLRFILL